MAANDSEAVQQVLERQEAAPAAMDAVGQVVDQHPLLVGLALVAALGYAVYHLLGTRSSDKEASTSGFSDLPADRNRAGDAEGE